MGERGLAAGVRAASYGYGMSMSEYAEQSNAETLVCVQIEEGEAVRNVDEIVQVEGVDVFFVGPSDLSQSLGYPGRPDAPVVREAMDSVFATIAGGWQGVRLCRKRIRTPPLHGSGCHLSVHAPDHAAIFGRLQLP